MDSRFPIKTAREIIDHASEAAEFLHTEADTDDESEVYTERSVSVDIGDTQIVGNIDHLRGTPNAFVITDYKTNRVSNQPTEELAEYYRPQLLSYALALVEYDPTREVRAQLYFTEPGVTKRFSWTRAEKERMVEEANTILSNQSKNRLCLEVLYFQMELSCHNRLSDC
jgi:ATP-dependent exoDNAse (exonuclease V) beta subunit (contains helicase and exonuclease domains)